MHRLKSPEFGLILKSLVFLGLALGSLPSANAKTVHVGDGQGTIKIDSMNGLEAGDTVIIAKGAYSGGTFTNLNGITIVPEAKAVVFNGPVTIGHDNKITFDGLSPDKPQNPNQATDKSSLYGYTFSGFNGRGFVPIGNNQNVTIQGVWFDNISGAVEAGGKIITYKGTPETTLFYNLTMDTVKITGKTTLYSGTWEPPKSYWNVNIGMTLKNVLCVNDGTGNTIKVFGHSLYKMMADGWKITGPTLNDTGDTGVFSIFGNVTLKNIYRNGGWGYLMRLYIVSLGEPTDSYVYNCVDVNSSNYGTIDSRVDPGSLALSDTTPLPIPLVGGNMHIYNVTSGDKRNFTHYITVLLVIGNMTDGKKQYVTDIKNCVAFDGTQGQDHGKPGADHDARGYLVQFNGLPGTVLNKSNNVDLNGPAPDSYFIDKDKFYPASGSPLIGKGVVLPQVTTDIYGQARGDTNDVGAVQHREKVSDTNKMGAGANSAAPANPK